MPAPYKAELEDRHNKLVRRVEALEKALAELQAAPPVRLEAPPHPKPYVPVVNPSTTLRAPPRPWPTRTAVVHGYA